MQKRLTWFVAIAATTALALTACSSDTTDAPAASSGGTLTVGLTLTDLPSLDTAYAFSVGGESMRWAGLQIYEGLLAWDLDQDTEIPTIEGGLAESWEANEDATAYTFTLREGVEFTDGTPFDADAVVFNIERYINPDAEGYSDDLAATAGLFTGGIGSVEKVDDSTVIINTADDISNGFILQDLTLLPFGSPTAIREEGDDFADNPVGTGPFEVVSRVEGQSITMEANPDYWKGAAKLDELVLKFIPNATARVTALRAGEVNFIETTPPDDIEALEAQDIKISTSPYSNVWRGVFDLNEEVWSDVRVRQAVNMAIDRESLVTDVLKGTASPAYQVASAADPGYDESLNDLYAYDPDAAKALLADAGYPDGFSATFSYASSGSGSMDANSIVAVIQSDLAEIGVNLELVPLEFATLSQQQNSGSMPGDASVAAWSGTFVLPSLWSVLSTTGGSNVGHYSNEEFDALFVAAKAEPDQAAQTEDFRQMNTLATEDAAWLPIATDENPRAMASNVNGFVNAKSWFLDVRGVSVG
jgi:peptide/nickel transport system substrate-binding protein